MPKVSSLQNNFSGGEQSPLFDGRVDSDRYKAALAKCLNSIPLIQGPVTNRPGSYFVAEVKDSTKKTRIFSFEFSTTQAYIIEFGHLYCRFYKDEGQILNLGVPYEISTPYTEADLFQLKFTQSADTLYIAHPNYAQRKLTRSAHTNWTLSTITFSDGPYLPTNTTGTTLTVSATTGVINITASSTTGINDGQGFLATDVGRLVRIKAGGTAWGWARILTRTSSTVVTADVGFSFSSTSPTATWRLGVWSDTTGYPGAVTFHEDRLFWAGSPNSPQRIDGSNSGDYENFAPSNPASDVITDSHAVAISLNANDVNVIRWLVSDEKGLLAGTVQGEWIVRPSTQGEALTPSKASAKRATAYGSANVQPVQAGKAVMFVQRAQKKIRELMYFYDVDGFRAPDATQIAEHILGNSGVTQLALQREPQMIVWCVRGDGVLAGMTYDRDQEALRVGWHKHVLGGVSDAAGNIAKVESIAVIPSSDATRDTLWLVVQRRINGVTKRYVEYFTKIFDSSTALKDAFFVDAGLTYDAPKAVSGATKANPVVITAVAHGFSNGDHVLFSDVAGMTELNTKDFKTQNVTADTFELVDSSTGAAINGSAFGDYISGGNVRKYVTTISGLSHLEGQTVTILADGASSPSKVVTSGAITLENEATTVQIGLGYVADGQLLRGNDGSADGTALGKTRRVHRVGFLLYRSVGLKIGMSFDNMYRVEFRKTSDPISRAVPLFTGIKSETVSADYDFDNQLCWRQDQPLPLTILAIMPQLVEQDR